MDADKLEAGPEIDMLIAKHIMGGLRVIPFPDAPFMDDWMAAGMWLRKIERQDSEGGWQPSTDIAAAWEMEERIEQRGCNFRYTQALMDVLLVDGFAPECDEELWWALIHASPYQRCRAALKAVED